MQFELTPAQIELLAGTIEAGWGRGYRDHHTKEGLTILEAFTEHLQSLNERREGAFISVS